MTTRFALLALLVALLAGAALAQPAKDKLETVSYAELGKIVRASKGKVVLVYFWAHY